MCGIFGLLGPGINHDESLHLRDKLCHRGPDDAGFWKDPSFDIWLGQRRLSVIDLSEHGHQPMLSSCARYVITYNGEIYNYKRIRIELEASGYSFQGDSDTEVLLASCAVWGVETAVQRFEGMFAFGLYDRLERILWLARDPMGIKPLYYTRWGESFAFASELTPLLSLSWVDRSVNKNAIFSYFRYGCIPSPVSAVNCVKKLPSGQLLRFDMKSLSIKPYWSFSRIANDLLVSPVSDNLSLKAAADRLSLELELSLSDHMQSDVPYGAFLSGGIDSSTIVALMQNASSKAVKTFSIGFSEDSHDESRYAKKIAEHLGTDHHELIISPDNVLENIHKVGAVFDEPFADNSAIPTYLVSKFAREHVTVCLSGDGGDELFGGYPRYFWAERIERIRKLLSPKGASIAGQLLRSMPKRFWNQVVDPVFGNRYSSSEGLAYRVERLANYLSTHRSQMYSKTMSIWSNPSVLFDYQPAHLLGADAINYPYLSWSEEMMLTDQENYLQDVILTKVDRASMAVSLETRVPFLTHPMLELSWQLPSSVKVSRKGDIGKLVLREILYRYVPRELIERPKQGFGMPMGKWLRGPLREWAESLLLVSDLDSCGLNSRIVKNAWEELLSGRGHQAQIWSVLMYRQWHQRMVGS